MSSTTQTYYEVLGLAQTASQSEIKQRYRELARQCHPDVASTPEAVHRFREINEANRVLSDPASRENYDAELILLARLQNPPPRQPSYTPPPKNGSKATTAAESKQSSPKGKPAASTQKTNPKGPAEVQRVLAEAHRALAAMRYREAEDLCRRALRLDSRSSAAYELLGDIHHKRGFGDEALAMYSFAVQVDRANRSAQIKLDRITGRPSGATMSGTAARAAKPVTITTSPEALLKLAQLGVTCFAAFLLIFTAYEVWSTPQPLAGTPWIFEWDALLVTALSSTGLAFGATCGVNGWLGNASNYLGLRRRRDGGIAVPLGFTMGLLSVVLFHASAILYMIIGTLQGHYSRNLLATCLITYGILGVFILGGGVAAPFILLFGGNLVYPALLIGWSVGTRLKG